VPTQSLEDKPTQVFERNLLEKATVGTTQLLSALFSLPYKPSDEGPLALLPTHKNDTSLVEGNSFTLLPREKTPPGLKEDTKWDKFAKEKGIEQRKRGRQAWDEDTGEWKYRTGADKMSKSKEDSWPIMEVKRGDDPYADPWEKRREERAEKVDKNMEARMRNLERTGELPKGSTAKTMKERKEKRSAGRDGNAVGDLVPAGVPVDLYEGGRRNPVTGRVDGNDTGSDPRKEAGGKS
jgi:hypothetical protein